MTRMMLIAISILLFAPPAFTMTLDEAVATALQNNPEVQSVKLEEGAA